jgi:hypothetical protein
MTTENIGWDEALKGNSKFVSFKADEQKVIVITNWRFEQNPNDAKIGAGLIAIKADVLEEDGQACQKVLDVSSTRLKRKLRPILETKQPSEKVKISVLKVGDKYDTQYSCKEILPK